MIVFQATSYFGRATQVHEFNGQFQSALSFLS